MAAFLIQFLTILITVLTWAILIRVLLTWIPNLDRGNPLVQLLAQITDPILEPARRIIPSIGGLDISPIVVLLLLRVIQQMLYSLR